MKIVYGDRVTALIAFEDVKAGEVFYHASGHYQKLSNSWLATSTPEANRLAVQLINGRLVHIPRDKMVTIVNAVLQVPE